MKKPVGRKIVSAYTETVPRLWNETIEEHRREVRDAILDTTASLATAHGLRSVTMSQIAGEAGIGRATLYKYFPDVEAILVAWHERQVDAHLGHLEEVRERVPADRRIAGVLEAYAFLLYGTHPHHDTDLAVFLHRDQQVVEAHQRLLDMVRDLLVGGVRAGQVRDDVPPDVLATYCLHALAASRSLRTEDAVRQLVDLTLSGLRPPPGR